MRLEEIGFYTLSDKRAAVATSKTPLERCELILTDRCNFSCPYCMGIAKQFAEDITFDNAAKIVDMWAEEGLKNIRFSGGEPTIWKGLLDIVSRARKNGIERIALSTNGSAKPDLYEKLVAAGVDDVSVSLDACCDTTGDVMAGVKGAYNRVISNIKMLSKLTYVTVGVVLTETNIGELDGIIKMASEELEVADIRIITASQWDEKFRQINVPDAILNKHPVLKYRVNNFRSGRHIRGLSEKDNNRCPLALDDMAIAGGYHFPCIIYMRRHGNPIGKVPTTSTELREERRIWVETHNTHKDEICRGFCLDVCTDYNNKVRELQGEK